MELRPKRPDLQLVKVLRDMLSEAESGDIEAVAGVFLRADGDRYTVAVGEYDPYQMHGLLAELNNEILSEAIEFEAEP